MPLGPRKGGSGAGTLAPLSSHFPSRAHPPREQLQIHGQTSKQLRLRPSTTETMKATMLPSCPLIQSLVTCLKHRTRCSGGGGALGLHGFCSIHDRKRAFAHGAGGPREGSGVPPSERTREAACPGRSHHAPQCLGPLAGDGVRAVAAGGAPRQRTSIGPLRGTGPRTARVRSGSSPTRRRFSSSFLVSLSP